MSNSQPSAFMTGLRGRCPACGKGPLFDGYIHLAQECSSCGLPYEFADSADGPAVFIMFIVGFIVIVAVIIVEILFKPPYWVHALLWLPAICLLSLFLLRPFKGVLIALQYKHQAREGRLEK